MLASHLKSQVKVHTRAPYIMRDSRRYAKARSTRRLHFDEETTDSVGDTAFLRKLIKNGDTTFVDSLVDRPLATYLQPETDSRFPIKRRRLPRPCLYIFIGMFLMYFILHAWEQRHTVKWWKAYKQQLSAFQSTSESIALTGYEPRMTRPARKYQEYAPLPELASNGMRLNTNHDDATSTNTNGMIQTLTSGKTGNQFGPASNTILRSTTATSKGYGNAHQAGFGTNNNNDIMEYQNHQGTQSANNKLRTDMKNNFENDQNTRSFNNIMTRKSELSALGENTQNMFAGTEIGRNNLRSVQAMNDRTASRSMQDQLETGRAQVQGFQFPLKSARQEEYVSIN